MENNVAVELWKNVKELLRKSLQKEAYQPIEKISPVSFNGLSFQLGVENAFTKIIAENQYRQPIQSALIELGAPGEITIEFVLQTESEKPNVQEVPTTVIAPVPTQSVVPPALSTPAGYWQRAKEIMLETKSVNQEEMERWLGLLVPVSFDEKNNRFLFSAENQFVKDWTDNNYREVIQKALTSICGFSNVTVEVTVAEQTVPSVEDRRQEEAPRPAPAPAPVAKKRSHASLVEMRSQLNPEFTFENFVSGPSNGWAYNAAGEVARKPGKAYNPLFIYGPTGIGKTHLMQAIGHRILETQSITVRYVTCESMLNDYVDCIAHKEKFADFRKRYRKTDVLMVDDIQFLAGKEGLQEEFFNIYNELHRSNKQIIMTSDLPPKEIAGLPERLVSRFSAGLVTQIECPKFETRLAILRYKQSQSHENLSDEVLTFIANNITTNVRALEGALNRTLSYLSLIRNSGEKVELGIDQLRSILHDLLENELQKELSCSEIQHAVCDYYGLTMKDMTSEERPRSIAEPRQLAMFLCRKLTPKSLHDISEAFHKTHATVLHSCKKMLDNLKLEKELYQISSEIVRKLGRDPSVLLQTQGG
ncbi:MAG: chromosomal replication initiator protein DnaA [Kiritimatiellae bacterium]|nr:chromosomal replication initiator protein DnaA [Kiritimatiellia bacterium]